MDATFRLPELGDGISEGTIIRVAIASGDEIESGQVLFEVETDKVVMEIPAECSGRVSSVLVGEGVVVKPGTALFDYAAANEAAAQDIAEAQDKPAEPEKPAEPAPAAATTSTPTAPSASIDQIPAASAATAAAEMTAALALRADILPFRSASTIIPAGPSVRRLARELGVDLAQIKGSGPQGRISKDDVKDFARQQLQHSHQPATARPAASKAEPESAVTPLTKPANNQPPAQAIDFSSFGPGHRESLSGIQQATSRNMDRTWCEIPHAWLQQQADITELEEQRQRYKTIAREEGISLSLTPFIVKALALALQQFPLFNACLDETDNTIVYRDYIDIGVAVDTPRGLVVPGVRQADNKSIAQIARDLDELAGKARDNKLSLQQMQGAGITLSNLGGMGVTSIYPLINWPQVAIVGIAAGQWQQQRIKAGEWQETLMMPMTLAFDHRIINGADGARFLGFLKTILEQPFRLCLY